jgi:hypothetical protein
LNFNYLTKLLASSLLFNATQASALILEQKLSVSNNIEFDSNPALATSNKQSVLRYTALPTYTASLSDDIDRWFAAASVSLQRSTNSSISENRQDPNLVFGWEHQFEKSLFNVTAEYNKTSSRLNEFISNGVVDKDGSATTKSISASWSSTITDRLNLSLAGQYLQTDYSGSGFSNYKTKSISSSLTYQLNEKVSPFVQVGVSELSSAARNAQAGVSQSYLVGTKAELMPNLNMAISLGLNHRKDAGNGWVANTTMTYLANKYNVQGSLSRNVTPSGLGQFQETNNLILRYAYELSDKCKVGSEFSWGSNGSAGGSDTLQIGTWYSKEISDLWLMKLNLNLKELNNDSQSANATIVGISFVYNTLAF